ncbi:helicase [Microbacterium sp. NPDC077184]|uniref:helicase n=1 Tax=Microbacterium sp. NPDC077184 TaxID=3154764 RepID=UPI00341D2C12
MASTAAVIGILAASATLVAGLSAVGAAAIHSQRLAGAADTSALAAADTVTGLAAGDPCDRAAELAATAGASVAACVIDGFIVTVTVTARFGVFATSATARAGPPPG